MILKHSLSLVCPVVFGQYTMLAFPSSVVYQFISLPLALCLISTVAMAQLSPLQDKLKLI